MSFNHTTYLTNVMPKLIKSFVEQAPVAIAMFDKKMNYIAASQRWLDDCHVSFKDVVGRCHYDVVPNIPDRWKKGHQRAMEGTPENCEEDCFELSEGKIEWLRWELQPWYESENIVGGLIMFVEHITKRKLAEQQVVKLVEQLNHSNEELRRFSYICSHDLKAPIRNISNFTQLLKEHVPELGKEDDTLTYYWDVIDENLERMQGMVQSFLLYAALGTNGIKKTWFEFSVLVDKVRLSLVTEIKKSGAVIKVDKLPKVFADQSLLTQVLYNLISNAIKFNRSSPPLIEVKTIEKERGWEVAIKDNGIGIQKAYWETVFDSFSRLHSKKEFPGTGVGLSFVRKVIEDHGGRVWVEDSSKDGTEFRVTLPKKEVT